MFRRRSSLHFVSAMPIKQIWICERCVMLLQQTSPDRCSFFLAQNIVISFVFTVVWHLNLSHYITWEKKTQVLSLQENVTVVCWASSSKFYLMWKWIHPSTSVNDTHSTVADRISVDVSLPFFSFLFYSEKGLTGRLTGAHSLQNNWLTGCSMRVTIM